MGSGTAAAALMLYHFINLRAPSSSNSCLRHELTSLSLKNLDGDKNYVGNNLTHLNQDLFKGGELHMIDKGPRTISSLIITLTNMDSPVGYNGRCLEERRGLGIYNKGDGRGMPALSEHESLANISGTISFFFYPNCCIYRFRHF